MAKVGSKAGVRVVRQHLLKVRERIRLALTALMLADQRQRSGSMHRLIFPVVPRRTPPGVASEDADDRNIYPKPVRRHRCLQQARPGSGARRPNRQVLPVHAGA